jgi:hypothetical protein
MASFFSTLWSAPETPRHVIVWFCRDVIDEKVVGKVESARSRPSISMFLPAAPLPSHHLRVRHKATNK